MGFLCMVTLVAMGAILVGCGKQEVQVNPQQEENNVTMSVTVSFDDDAGTRALDVDFVNKTAVKTFLKGDRIAVIYKNVNNETVKAVGAISSGAGTSSAIFKVTLSNPDNTQAVRYIYPAAMAKGTVSPDAAIDDDGTIDFTNLHTQDGTLSTLGRTLDLCVYDAPSWTSGKLPSGTLANRLTICAFTLKDLGGTSTITRDLAQLTVSDGTNSYVIVPNGNFEDVVYVAMLPVTTAAALELVGTAAPYVYVKIATSRTYPAGTFNNLALRMTRAVNLSLLEADYTAKKGDVLTGTTNWYVRIPSGVTVTLYEANILSSGIICSGTATIILMGSNTVTAGTGSYKGAVCTGEYGHTLTITGTGSLDVSAEGQENKAGIGPSGAEYGRVVINGGTITATGGANGAGIGSAGNARCGSITINGGTVIATGGANGAGIGAAGNARCDETITISGGTVIAIGGTNSAGIGSGGSEYASNGGIGCITIKGGTVTATGGTNGAGIGSGIGRCDGTILISGGTVTAIGGTNGAGIGSGNGRSEFITISGGTVTATGGTNSAGIGSGGSTSARCTNNIIISGGTVTVTGGPGGAGIGSGMARCDGTIRISGGTVTATGGTDGAGIGLAKGRLDFIYITGGTVTATGGSNSAGIGTGTGNCSKISISDTVTKVTAIKGSGSPNSIGKGASGRVDSVIIGGVSGAISESPYTYEP